jgi:hypothetical protein
MIRPNGSGVWCCKRRPHNDRSKLKVGGNHIQRARDRLQLAVNPSPVAGQSRQVITFDKYVSFHVFFSYDVLSNPKL